MKIKLLIIAAVVLIVGLSACNKEEALSQDGLPINVVRITATVGNPFAATRSNPVGDEAAQAKFNVGDKIYVDKFSRIRMAPAGVVYELGGANWAPTNNRYLLWVEDMETFSAYYPVNEEGFPIYSVQQDQSTLSQLALSDIMFAEIIDATKGTALNFVMERQTRRIIVKIEGFNPEFTAGSVVTDVKIMVKNPVVYGAPPSEYTAYSPYSPADVDGSVGSTYTLLADDSMSNMYVSLKVGEKEMRTASLRSMEAAKSYTFNLNVGKEKLEIGNVTVEDWTGTVDLPNGEAGEGM